MKNLWKETEEKLTEYGKTWEDVLWVGNRDFKIDKVKFRNLATQIYYDNEDGTTEVATDLMVIGSNWGLRRKYEQDGSELWEYIEMPSEPEETMEINALTIREYLDENGYRILNGFSTLEELNPTQNTNS